MSASVRRALPTLPAVRDLVRIYGLQAKSQLSQNFILDKNVTDKIVKTAKLGFDRSLVVEVGPGPGLLTRSILDAGAERLVVIEKDERFLPSLQQLADACEPGRLTVISGDVLAVTPSDIIRAAYPDVNAWQDQCSGVHLLGNLPFNIASPLLITWLRAAAEKSGLFSVQPAANPPATASSSSPPSPAWSMTLMFQKEVAERIAAPAHHTKRGRLSVMSQAVSQTRISYQVPASVFIPKPKVDASVIQLLPNTATSEAFNQIPYRYLEDVVRYAFTKRRKTMRNVMRRALEDHPELAESIFSDLDGADVATIRPQNMTTEAFCQLAHRLYTAGVRMPSSSMPNEMNDEQTV